MKADLTRRSYDAAKTFSRVVMQQGRVQLDADWNELVAQITRRFPRIDFVLRSHSSASPIPYCIDGYSVAFPQLRSQQAYIEEFARFALHVKARYAIPFASNHCFLHRDTVQFNRTSVSPEDVRRQYQRIAQNVAHRSECVVMTPGSSWDDFGGFQIAEFDYSRRDEYVSELHSKHAVTLASQYALEAAARADFTSFERYFSEFVRAVPWFLRRWMGLRAM